MRSSHLIDDRLTRHCFGPKSARLSSRSLLVTRALYGLVVDEPGVGWDCDGFTAPRGRASHVRPPAPL
jgi:hypothetical protein